MSKYHITNRTVELVQELKKRGYSGQATITNRYPTGAKAIMGDDFSIELTGFCKESMYLCEEKDSCNFIMVGRYDLEFDLRPTDGRSKIDLLIEQAWRKYKTYKPRGYSMPCEWEEVFKKTGYITVEMQPVYIEKD